MKISVISYSFHGRGVEHHTGREEYAEVGVQIAHVRTVLEHWRVTAEG